MASSMLVPSWQGGMYGEEDWLILGANEVDRMAASTWHAAPSIERGLAAKNDQVHGYSPMGMCESVEQDEEEAERLVSWVYLSCRKA